MSIFFFTKQISHLFQLEKKNNEITTVCFFLDMNPETFFFFAESA